MSCHYLSAPLIIGLFVGFAFLKKKRLIRKVDFQKRLENCYYLKYRTIKYPGIRGASKH